MHPRVLRPRVVLGFPAVLLTLAASWRGDIKPCELLTPAQVSTVLPKSDKGFVAANGESLIQGVKSYQCSYVNPEAHLLRWSSPWRPMMRRSSRSPLPHRDMRTIARSPSLTAAGYLGSLTT